MPQKLKTMILKSIIIKIKFLILIEKYIKCICNKTSIVQKASENNAKCFEIPLYSKHTAKHD